VNKTTGPAMPFDDAEIDALTTLRERRSHVCSCNDLLGYCTLGRLPFV
jgi:hypothetical protein